MGLRRSQGILLAIGIIIGANSLEAKAQGPSPEEVARDMTSCEAFAVPVAKDNEETEDNLIRTALNIRPSTVQVQVGSEYGTGNIISVSNEKIFILTAKHVVKSWRDDSSNYVIFYNGFIADAVLEKTDDYYDVAVISVNASDIDAYNLLRLRSVKLDYDVISDFDKKKNEVVFSLDSEHVVNAKEVQTYDYFGKDTGIGYKYVYGPVINPDIMVRDYGYNMLYVKCDAHSGMSGGGVFDINGNYVGMLVGGSDKKEMVAVRLPDMRTMLEGLE
ncbi:S1 family peptidase [Butyrivibrio sp. FC2001]|uniref:S1 family peptidase n=1 Tax=Butyrivibrio sp. FC2001 TaxID=1280671 RepID=UPI00041C1FE8|nr:serine protease [Butyrivibrio sp. FC2001]